MSNTPHGHIHLHTPLLGTQGSSFLHQATNLLILTYKQQVMIVVLVFPDINGVEIEFDTGGDFEELNEYDCGFGCGLSI